MSPYMKTNNECQIELLLDKIFQAHLLSSAILEVSQWFTLKPASSFGFQVVDKDTRFIVES